MEPADLEAITAVAHEANRAYCLTLGDNSQLPWSEAPDWQKESAVKGVMFHYLNPTADASASHQSWYEEKERNGWTYGPTKDPANKRHPCFVPFSELPIEQQIKDHIFRSVVHGLLHIRSGT